MLAGLAACAPRIVERLPFSRLGRQVHQLLTDPGQGRAQWGILAVNLRTGRTIIDYHADRHLVPASNTKLYTAAAALALLGADYRFYTPILATGPVVEGQLQGDLVVVGIGDPSWSARMRDDDATSVFAGWADSLRQRGIESISGDIVGVDALFDGLPFGYGWMWDDEPFRFGAPISALSFNDNMVAIKILPRPGQTPELELHPVTSYLTIHNNLTTLDTLNNPDSLEADWELDRLRGSSHVYLDGISRPDTIETGAAVENPPLFTAHVLKEVLEREGLAIAGEAVGFARYGPHRDPLELAGDTLFMFVSPALGEVIHEMNKESVNLLSEMLLRSLASDVEGGASAEAGLRRARPVWAALGVDTTTIRLVDGSGVSHINRVTPRSTVALLTAMQGDSTFFHSLPIAGVDGTLEDLMTDSPATGRVFAKTGTLTSARALSGYLVQAGGDTLAFSIMANSYLTPLWQVNRYMRRICELLVGG